MSPSFSLTLLAKTMTRGLSAIAEHLVPLGNVLWQHVSWRQSSQCEVFCDALKPESIEIRFRPGLRSGPRWRSSRRSPRPSSRLGSGKCPPILHSLDAFGVSAPRLRLLEPLPHATVARRPPASPFGFAPEQHIRPIVFDIYTYKAAKINFLNTVRDVIRTVYYICGPALMKLIFAVSYVSRLTNDGTLL